MTLFKDIPVNDIVAYQQYPKLRPVYQIKHILELQNIHCSLIKENLDQWMIPDYSFNFSRTLIRKPPCTTSENFQLGYFFAGPLEGDHYHADVAILKGNVVWSQSFKYDTEITLINKEISGNLDLKLNALITMLLHKFTGVIEIEIIGEVIVSIHLKPRAIHLYSKDIKEQITKLYNKSIW